MAEYRNIPVDPETYEMVKALGEAYERKMGAQVRVMARAEWEKLAAAKLVAANKPGMTGEQEFRAELRG